MRDSRASPHRGVSGARCMTAAFPQVSAGLPGRMQEWYEGSLVGAVEGLPRPDGAVAVAL